MILKKTSFNPAIISGCKFWIDASDTSSMKCNLSRQFINNQYIGTDTYQTGIMYSGQYSFAVWATSYVNHAGNVSLLSLRSSGSATPVLGWLRLNGTTPQFYVSDAAGFNSTAGVGSVSPGVMFCVIGTRDGDDVKLYLNGSSTLGTTPSDIISTMSNQTCLTLGASINGSSAKTNFFTGIIHNGCIWNSCLTQEQINSFYNGGSPLKYSQLSGVLVNNLIEYFSLGETSGVAINGKTNTNLNQFGNAIGVFGVQKDIYNGCGVTSINSKAGNSHIAITLGSGVNSPTYRIFSGVNLSALSFTNSSLNIDFMSGLFNSQKYSIVSAHLPYTTDNLQSLIGAGNIAGDAVTLNTAGNTVLSGNYKFGATNYHIAGGANYDGPCLFYHANITGTLNQYSNGANHTSNNFVPSNFAMSTISIGALNTGNVSNYYNGAINELVLYDNSLSHTNRNSLLTYLGQKWNMTPLLYPRLTAWLDPKDRHFITINTSNVVTSVKNKVRGPRIIPSWGTTFYEDNSLKMFKSAMVITGLVFPSGQPFAIFTQLGLRSRGNPPNPFVYGTYGTLPYAVGGFYQGYTTGNQSYNVTLSTNNNTRTTVNASGVENTNERIISLMTIAPNRFVAFNNGSSGYINTVGYDTASFPNYILGGFTVDAAEGPNTNNMSGMIGAFIAYNTGLSLSDRSAVEYYISRQRGINLY